MIIGGINPAKLTFLGSENRLGIITCAGDGKVYEITYYSDQTQNRPIAIAVVKKEMQVDNQEVLEYFNAEGNYDIEKWESNHGVNPEKLTYVGSNNDKIYFEYTDGKTYIISYYIDNTKNRPMAIEVVEENPGK